MAAVPRVAMPIGSADARMPLLDAVKGVACVLIVGPHLARYGPMADSASALAPSFFGWLAQFGGKMWVVSPKRVVEQYKRHILSS